LIPQYFNFLFKELPFVGAPERLSINNLYSYKTEASVLTKKGYPSTYQRRFVSKIHGELLQRSPCPKTYQKWVPDKEYSTQDL